MRQILLCLGSFVSLVFGNMVDLSHFDLSEEQIAAVCGKGSPYSLCNFWWNMQPEAFWDMNYNAKHDFHRQSERLVDAWRNNGRITSKEEAKDIPPPNLPAKIKNKCRPLPPDYLGNWSNYVLNSQHCYLPSSRSYLLSYFSSAIQMEASDMKYLRSGRLKPGGKARVIFGACQAKLLLDGWRDIWSRQFPIENVDLESVCDHLGIWGRLIEARRTRVEKGGARSIWNIDIEYKGKCKWEASFVVPQSTWINSTSGSFMLEIMNNWVHGMVGAGAHDNGHTKTPLERLKCNAKSGFSWSGATSKELWDATFFVPDVLSHGSSRMECCDRCMLHEQCKSWVHWENNDAQQNCWLFNRLPPTSTHSSHGGDSQLQEALKKLFQGRQVISGTRRDIEEIQLYLGGSNKHVEGQIQSTCASQGHILGSPFQVEYSLQNAGKKIVDASDVLKKQMVVESENQFYDMKPVDVLNHKSSTWKSSEHQTVHVKSAITKGNVYEQSLHSKDCGRSYVGQYSGFWTQFNAVRTCNITGLQKEAIHQRYGEKPICHLLQHDSSPRITSSGKGPSLYDSDPNQEWNDLTWTLNANCRINHFTTFQARVCFAKNNISKIVFAGDSVVDVFADAVKYILGKNQSWIEKPDMFGSTAHSFNGPISHRLLQEKHPNFMLNAIAHKFESTTIAYKKQEQGNHEDKITYELPKQLKMLSSTKVGKRFKSAKFIKPPKQHSIEFQYFHVKASQLDVDPLTLGRELIDELKLPTQKGGTTLLVLNLGIHHLLWHHSLPWIEKAAESFAYGLKQRLGSLVAHREISFTEFTHMPVEFIFITPSAVQAYSQPHVTMERAREVSHLLKKIMIAAGFRVLDAFNMEISRPEMTKDGVHYNDAMNYMQAQVLFNMICNEQT